MADLPNVCVDKTLPDNLIKIALEKSFAANPANDHRASPLEMAVENEWLWAPGSILKVRFLDGDPTVQQRVQEIAKEWEKYANITLDFDDHDVADIRISFKLKGQSWSWIGTQALAIKDQQTPTMNFGWLEPNSPAHVYSSVVLHEFGHALGCIHEHQHPENGIPWDEAAVMAYYTGPPNKWTPELVRHNVLDAYSVDVTQFSKFDPKSIMLYPVPNAHTVGNWSIDWENAELSATDKQFIGRIYPKGKGKRAGTTPGNGGGKSTVTIAAQPLAAPALDGGDDIADRNELARAIRAEVFNLQIVLKQIEDGTTNLKESAPYLKKTAEDVPGLVTALVAVDSGDLVRNVQNQWEQMAFNPLLVNPEGEFEAQQQSNLVGMLNGNIDRIVTLVGDMTIPETVTAWLDNQRTGYYFSFHDVFEDELPKQADRDRLLRHLAWSPDVLAKKGVVDQANGLIYRTSNDAEEQKKSRNLILWILLATVGVIILLTLPSLVNSEPAWPLTLTDIPILLVGWAAVLVGTIVHVMIGSYKRSRLPGGMPPIIAIGDFSLWLNAKTGQIIFRIALALFALFGLAFSAGIEGVTILNTFLIGYSLDSFVEIFSGALDSEATNLSSDLKSQQG